MNFKNIFTSVVAGTALLTLVGSASAATKEVNVYGASAQYLYWSSQAPNFLTAQGCYGNGWTKTKDSKNMIAVGTCANGDTMIFRVSSKASYDGILALQGNATDPNHVNECDNVPGAGPTYRKMVDETSCSGANCTATKCVKVTVGASDVEGGSFMQSSQGALLGPNGGAATTRSFSGIDTTGLADVRKIVVPFAFFANKGVTKLNPATQTMDTITNLSRMQAVMIFSGQSWYWQDFGPDYNTQPITACLRHAGSGTHATIDLAVMHGAWGGALVTAETAGGPNVYFNDGSSDEMNCINGITGAVGYADADQANLANTVELTYNGVAATRANIRNGEYDNFWSVQNCYYHPSDTLAAAACNSVDSIPASKAGFWAKVCEMTYMKGHDDQYPQYVGATCAP
jgi:hypothetical protein